MPRVGRLLLAWGAIFKVQVLAGIEIGGLFCKSLYFSGVVVVDGCGAQVWDEHLERRYNLDRLKRCMHVDRISV